MNQPAGPASSDPLLTGLLARITGHRPDADGQLITRAYRAAARWHQGQQRKSGDPYVTHPVAVASILAGLGADDQTLCAALLHDVVEDTPYTLAAMRQEFGAEITGLVAAVMALEHVPAERVAAACTDSAAAIALAGDRRALMNRGGLDVLATLRRSGPPYRLTPTRLAAELVLTTGAMTHRVDALVQAGLVRRFADPADRRSSLVGLTEQGQDAAVRAMAAHMAGEAELLSALAPADRRALAALLARLLTGIEE